MADLSMLGAMGGQAAGPSEEDLLAQIRQLLDAYMALGGDTPVAPEAQALAQAIDSTMGGGQDTSGGQPQIPNTADEGAAEPVAPEESDTYSGGSFNKATSGAKEFLKKKNKAKAS